MNKEDAIRVAKELVEHFETKIEHGTHDTYVIIYKELVFTTDIKTLLPYFEKYAVAIYADGQNQIRIVIR